MKSRILLSSLLACLFIAFTAFSPIPSNDSKEVDVEEYIKVYVKKSNGYAASYITVQAVTCGVGGSTTKYVKTDSEGYVKIPCRSSRYCFIYADGQKFEKNVYQTGNTYTLNLD
jgi:hypothetical protein